MGDPRWSSLILMKTASEDHSRAPSWWHFLLKLHVHGLGWWQYHLISIFLLYAPYDELIPVNHQKQVWEQDQ
jgi:hypothetical protein